MCFTKYLFNSPDFCFSGHRILGFLISIFLPILWCGPLHIRGGSRNSLRGGVLGQNSSKGGGG